MSRLTVTIRVVTSFRKMLKRMALNDDMSLIELSEKLSDKKKKNEKDLFDLF